MTEKRTWRKDYRYGYQDSHPNFDDVVNAQQDNDYVINPEEPGELREAHIGLTWGKRKARARFRDACELLEDAQADIEGLRQALRDVHQIHSTIEVGPQSLNNISKLINADRIIWDALHEIPKETQDE